MKTTIKTLIATAGLILAVSNNAAYATEPSVEQTCTKVAHVAYLAAEWRDGGMPYTEAVREFNHGWNEKAPVTVAARRWKRFFDAVIRGAYQPPHMAAENERDLSYGQCVRLLNESAADDPDPDLRSDPNDEDAQGSL